MPQDASACLSEKNRRRSTREYLRPREVQRCPCFHFQVLERSRLPSSACHVSIGELLRSKLAQLDMSARHHPPGDLDELVDVVGPVRLSVTPGERRHVLRRNSSAVNVRPGTKYCASREHRSDTGLHMISKHRAQKLLAGIPQS